jgi:glutathione S-transferase
MKLYSTWSLNPQKILFAVKELGLSTALVEVDLFRGEQRTDWVAPYLGVSIDADAIARGQKDLERPMFTLNQLLASGEWMLGGAFSLVDCCIGTDLVGLAASKFDWAPYSAVRSYVERIRTRDAWRATASRH